MRIDELWLEGFRNYDIQHLTFDRDCNVIYGENAQGKTNLLEAIVYLSCGKSPRTHSDRELIGFDRDFASLSGQIHSRDRDFKTELRLVRGQRRRMSVNGVSVKTNAALSDVLHTVFFAPEDLFLIRDGAAARRRFMDLSLCQLRPRYAEALAEYHRLYEHKTRILRDSEEFPHLLDTLPDFNGRLCQVGAVLIHYRARFCRALAEHAAQAHAECSGGRETLALSYETVRTVADPLAELPALTAALEEHQRTHYDAEIASRLCLSGPHKDDLLVEVNGRSARQYCSQGQVRTAALALKLAEREIHKNTFGEYPVMLLDDVLSELDPRRQEYVLNRIAGGQIFITCCENDRLDALVSGKVFHIREGKVI
ncbi:MAG: DNA replication/repair protein RecF [Ruminococcaceae bacterium]|nr:DNA replication/repair protein RecF [Oscillospiraceae bacterium]